MPKAKRRVNVMCSTMGLSPWSPFLMQIYEFSFPLHLGVSAFQTAAFGINMSHQKSVENFGRWFFFFQL